MNYCPKVQYAQQNAAFWLAPTATAHSSINFFFLPCSKIRNLYCADGYIYQAPLKRAQYFRLSVKDSDADQLASLLRQATRVAKTAWPKMRRNLLP
jgi:hypothetical protein